MHEKDVEGLKDLMRKAVTEAIVTQTSYILLFVEEGSNGSACFCKSSDLNQVLADHPQKEFVILCTITADGEIQPSTGDIRLKHKG